MNTQLETEALYRKFRDPLRSFIGRRVADPSTAEDLVHDVFVKIHSQIGSLKQTEKLTSWIYQIARNAVIDFYRKRKETIPYLDEETLFVDQERISDAAEKLVPGLRSMIEQLPPKYRETLKFADIEGIKYAEIATRMGISVSAVKSRVQRGRGLLKNLLLQCCHFEFDKYGTVFDYEPRKCEKCC